MALPFSNLIKNDPTILGLLNQTGGRLIAYRHLNTTLARSVEPYLVYESQDDVYEAFEQRYPGCFPANRRNQFEIVVSAGHACDATYFGKLRMQCPVDPGNHGCHYLSGITPVDFGHLIYQSDEILADIAKREEIATHTERDKHAPRGPIRYPTQAQVARESNAGRTSHPDQVILDRIMQQNQTGAARRPSPRLSVRSGVSLTHPSSSIRDTARARKAPRTSSAARVAATFAEGSAVASGSKLALVGPSSNMDLKTTRFIRLHFWFKGIPMPVIISVCPQRSHCVRVADYSAQLRERDICLDRQIQRFEPKSGSWFDVLYTTDINIKASGPVVVFFKEKDLLFRQMHGWKQAITAAHSECHDHLLDLLELEDEELAAKEEQPDVELPNYGNGKGKARARDLSSDNGDRKPKRLCMDDDVKLVTTYDEEGKEVLYLVDSSDEEYYLDD